MKLAQRALNLTPSEPRRIYDAAQKYNNVIDLTLGDPDLPPPPNIQDAACQAIKEGKTRYSANAGLLKLRQAIAQDAQKSYNISFDPNSEIIITVGAMESAYLCLWSMLNAGDEAIIPTPYWINYGEVVKSLGATPVFVETRPENSFIVQAEDIEAKITAKTKLIILNSPANPTGAIIPKNILEKIATLVKKHDLMVLSDEIYSNLIYDGKKATSILTIDGMKERTAIINGFSKRFAMTGWRVGYTLGPKDLISCMTQMTENIVACAPLPSQYAAIEALSDRTNANYILEEFEKRRNCVLEELKTIPEISTCGIPGTFYAFLDVSQSNMTGEEFAMSLLESKQVALVHGSAYGGKSYENFVRIAFTMNCNELRKAFARIREFLAKE